jgi:hypothetical protein
MGGKIIYDFFRRVILVFKLKLMAVLLSVGWPLETPLNTCLPSIRVEVLKFIIAVLPKKIKFSKCDICKLCFSQYLKKMKHQLPRKPPVLSLKPIGCLRF